MIWVMMSPLFLAVTLAALVPVLIGIVHDDRARRTDDGAGHFLVASPKRSPKPVAVATVEAEVALTHLRSTSGEDQNAALPALIS
jgi:hypothetical protein